MRDRELVAIGAAIASNCIPCVEFHIPQARKVGLSDAQIAAAVELADKVRRVPADKVLQTATALLVQLDPGPDEGEAGECGCSDDARTTGNRPDTGSAEPHAPNTRLDNERKKEDNGKMMGMMEMMQRCCPDKVKDFSSLISKFHNERSSPDENSGSKEDL